MRALIKYRQAPYYCQVSYAAIYQFGTLETTLICIIQTLHNILESDLLPDFVFAFIAKTHQRQQQKLT